MSNFLFLLAGVFLIKLDYSCQASCKDEAGREVDWYIIYKLPKLKDVPSKVANGLSYFYLTSNKETPEWILSERFISSSMSMLGKTLKKFYANSSELTYFLYNDEVPSDHSYLTLNSSRDLLISRLSRIGHTKGIVVFDKNDGFWIIHSVPKFPSQHSWNYPSNAVKYGQVALCISFEIQSLNEIGKQLLYNAPHIYARNLNVGGLDADVQSLFLGQHHFVHKLPFYRFTTLESKGKHAFKIFSKDAQFSKDLYSALIAPELNVSLMVESWRNGAGAIEGPYCTLHGEVLDILSMAMTFKENESGEEFRFSSFDDHSKWAISMKSKVKWICIGDINRMDKQKKRGGGAACFSSSYVWRIFNSSIVSTNYCPTVK